ncbi:unnamed protein product [Caenorhabditis auriculariae]|uniref:Uncharacterized protein n=1 Tax=Caenorhabditis auriculariae TaxID=2777116 RepID=A0A8S1HZP7_9PELO|nr:unnamed protein product [Caenorhabditis auriculariae]
MDPKLLAFLFLAAEVSVVSAVCNKLKTEPMAGMDGYNSPWVFYDYSVVGKVTVTCIGEGETQISYPSLDLGLITCPPLVKDGPTDYQTVTCDLTCTDSDKWTIQPPKGLNDGDVIYCTAITVPASIPTTTGLPTTPEPTTKATTQPATTSETVRSTSEAVSSSSASPLTSPITTEPPTPCKNGKMCSTTARAALTSKSSTTNTTSTTTPTKTPSKSSGLPTSIIVLLCVLSLLILLFIAGLFYLFAVIRHRRQAAAAQADELQIRPQEEIPFPTTPPNSRACGVLINGTIADGLPQSPLVTITYDDVAGTAEFGCTGWDDVIISYNLNPDTGFADINCNQTSQEGKGTVFCKLFCDVNDNHWHQLLGFATFVEDNTLYCESDHISTDGFYGIYRNSTIDNTNVSSNFFWVHPSVYIISANLYKNIDNTLVFWIYCNRKDFHIIFSANVYASIDNTDCEPIVNGSTNPPGNNISISPLVQIEYLPEHLAKFACTGIGNAFIAFYFENFNGEVNSNCEDARVEEGGYVTVSCIFECNVDKGFWTKKTSPSNELRIINNTIYCETATPFPTPPPVQTTKVSTRITSKTNPTNPTNPTTNSTTSPAGATSVLTTVTKKPITIPVKTTTATKTPKTTPSPPRSGLSTLEIILIAALSGVVVMLIAVIVFAVLTYLAKNSDSPYVSVDYDDVSATANFHCTGDGFTAINYNSVNGETSHTCDETYEDGVQTVSCLLFCNSTDGHWYQFQNLSIFVINDTLYCERSGEQTPVFFKKLLQPLNYRIFKHQQSRRLLPNKRVQKQRQLPSKRVFLLNQSELQQSALERRDFHFRLPEALKLLNRLLQLSKVRFLEQFLLARLLDQHPLFTCHLKAQKSLKHLLGDLLNQQRAVRRVPKRRNLSPHLQKAQKALKPQLPTQIEIQILICHQSVISWQYFFQLIEPTFDHFFAIFQYCQYNTQYDSWNKTEPRFHFSCLDSHHESYLIVRNANINPVRLNNFTLKIIVYLFDKQYEKCQFHSELQSDVGVSQPCTRKFYENFYGFNHLKQPHLLYQFWWLNANFNDVGKACLNFDRLPFNFNDHYSESKFNCSIQYDAKSSDNF